MRTFQVNVGEVLSEYKKNWQNNRIILKYTEIEFWIYKSFYENINQT